VQSDLSERKREVLQQLARYADDCIAAGINANSTN